MPDGNLRLAQNAYAPVLSTDDGASWTQYYPDPSAGQPADFAGVTITPPPAGGNALQVLDQNGNVVFLIDQSGNTDIQNLSFGADSVISAESALTFNTPVNFTERTNATALTVGTLSLSNPDKTLDPAALFGLESIKGAIDVKGRGLIGAKSVYGYNLADNAVTLDKIAPGAITVASTALATQRDSKTQMYRAVTSSALTQDAANQPIDQMLATSGAARAADAQAAAGWCIQWNAGTVSNGAVVVDGPFFGAPGHGPGLVPGHYRVTFYVKVASVASANQLIGFQITDATAGSVVAQATTVWSGQQIGTANAYVGVAVPLTVTADLAATAGLRCLVTSYSASGSVVCSFSHVSIAPYDAPFQAEISDTYIKSVSATKITTGTLAVTTVATIGNPAGARVDLVGGSVGSYTVGGIYAWDASSNNTVSIKGDGTAFFGGTLTSGVSINAPVITGGTITSSSLSSATISAGTITGAVVQTSASNPRVALDTNGIRAWDTNGYQTLTISASDGSFSNVGGSITGGVINGGTINAGTTMPTSIYNQNHIPNSGFEDIDPISGGIAGLSYDSSNAVITTNRWSIASTYINGAYVLYNQWGAPTYAAGTTYTSGAYVAQSRIVYQNVSGGSLTGVTPGVSANWSQVGYDFVWWNNTGSIMPAGVVPGFNTAWTQVSFGSGSAGVVGTSWLVWQAGPTSSPLAGSHSLVLQTNNNTSGCSAATGLINCMGGENWQIRMDLQMRLGGGSTFRPIFVRIYFYDANGNQLTTAVPAGSITNAVLLTTSGAFSANVTPTYGSGGNGTADILNSFTPSNGTAFRVSGTVKMPTTATKFRIALYLWQGAVANAGTTYLVADNGLAMRALDGHSGTIMGSTIIGSVIETGTSGSRVVISPTNAIDTLTVDGSPSAQMAIYPSFTQPAPPRVIGAESTATINYSSFNIMGGLTASTGIDHMIRVFSRNTAQEGATSGLTQQAGIMLAPAWSTGAGETNLPLEMWCLANNIFIASQVNLNSALQWCSGELRVSGARGTYSTIAAASFPVRTSVTASKTDIVDIPFDPLALITANPAKQFKHKPGYTTTQQDRIGVMADNLPNVLRADHPDGPEHAGYDLVGVVGVLWEAVRRLKAQVDALKGK